MYLQYVKSMRFEWDEAKNQANRRKHGLDFADAHLVFAGRTLTFEDLRQSIDAEAETRRQVIRSRYSFVDALLSLEEAVGAPVAGLAAVGR